jgi:hypothetical protein
MIIFLGFEVMMDTPLLSGPLGTFDTLTFNVILTISNTISKNLPSRSQAAQKGFQL